MASVVAGPGVLSFPALTSPRTRTRRSEAPPVAASPSSCYFGPHDFVGKCRYMEGWYGEKVVVCQQCHYKFGARPVPPQGSAPKAGGRGVGPSGRTKALVSRARRRVPGVLHAHYALEGARGGITEKMPGPPSRVDGRARASASATGDSSSSLPPHPSPRPSPPPCVPGGMYPAYGSTWWVWVPKRTKTPLRARDFFVYSGVRNQ
jgi:hypothetical protein